MTKLEKQKFQDFVDTVRAYPKYFHNQVDRRPAQTREAQKFVANALQIFLVDEFILPETRVSDVVKQLKRGM